MAIREAREQFEEHSLSPHAFLSKNTRGRQRPAPPCEIRTDFQRDRDRIIHSKAFRRLKHKTQVFIIPEGDHYRTRLTHTLEVSQIARTIARALALNEDLTEAIALGHDLGHTPFGHAGEEALDKLCPLGFKHYKQSLRVVEVLENEGDGMNLTWEVRDGIVNHTGTNMAATLEGIVVKYADRIAYINHDIDDAVRADVISEEALPAVCVSILGDSHGKRIDALVSDLVENSGSEIRMSGAVAGAMSELRKFMFDNIYIDSIAKKEEKKAQKIVEALYAYFISRPGELPSYLQAELDRADIHRVVCDYIAGMTDTYAIKTFKQIFLPTPWRDN